MAREIAEKMAQAYMHAYEEYGLDAEKFPLESLFSPEDFEDVQQTGGGSGLQAYDPSAT